MKCLLMTQGAGQRPTAIAQPEPLAHSSVELVTIRQYSDFAKTNWCIKNVTAALLESTEGG